MGFLGDLIEGIGTIATLGTKDIVKGAIKGNSFGDIMGDIGRNAIKGVSYGAIDTKKIADDPAEGIGQAVQRGAALGGAVASGGALGALGAGAGAAGGAAGQTATGGLSGLSAAEMGSASAAADPLAGTAGSSMFSAPAASSGTVSGIPTSNLMAGAEGAPLPPAIGGSPPPLEPPVSVSQPAMHGGNQVTDDIANLAGKQLMGEGVGQDPFAGQSPYLQESTATGPMTPPEQGGLFDGLSFSDKLRLAQTAGTIGQNIYARLNPPRQPFRPGGRISSRFRL